MHRLYQQSAKNIRLLTPTFKVFYGVELHWAVASSLLVSPSSLTLSKAFLFSDYICQYYDERRPLTANDPSEYYKTVRLITPCSVSFSGQVGRIICLEYYDKIRTKGNELFCYRRFYSSIRYYYNQREGY